MTKDHMSDVAQPASMNGGDWETLLTLREVMKTAYLTGGDRLMSVWERDLNAMDAAITILSASRRTKSAPEMTATHNSGERSPSSDAVNTGADTQCSAGSEPVAWRVDGTRGGETHVWFYWKPEWPAMHVEHGDKVTPLYSDPPQAAPVTPETTARAAGWIAEIEYNGEDDGVRHPASGNWSENWEGACRQIGAVK